MHVKKKKKEISEKVFNLIFIKTLDLQCFVTIEKRLICLRQIKEEKFLTIFREKKLKRTFLKGKFLPFFKSTQEYVHSHFSISLVFFLLSATQNFFSVAYADLKVICSVSHVLNSLGINVSKSVHFKTEVPLLMPSSLRIWISGTSLAQSGRVANYQKKESCFPYQ